LGLRHKEVTEERKHKEEG